MSRYLINITANMLTVYVTVEQIQSGTLHVKIKPLVVLYRERHNIRIKVCSKAVCGFVLIASLSV